MYRGVGFFFHSSLTIPFAAFSHKVKDTVGDLEWRPGHPDKPIQEEETGTEKEKGEDEETEQFHMSIRKLSRCGRQIQNLLHHQTHGSMGEAAEIVLYILQTKSKFYMELREEMDLPAMDGLKEHQHVASTQARSFKEMCETVKEGDLIICTDFSMNLGHAHQHSFQNEHWCKFQSTMMPMVCIRRDKHGNVALEAIVAVSDDLTHSNNFVHHCLEFTINKYQDVTEGGIAHVHIWSDGCSEQFKSKYQMMWVSEARTTANLIYKDGPPPIIHHHFFASCHGKNMCDGLAGYIKTWIAREEVNGLYFADTKSLLPWLKENIEAGDFGVGDRSSSLPEVSQLHVDQDSPYVRKGGRFSTIRILYVPFGDVIHEHLYDVRKVDGIKSYHTFTSVAEKKVREALSNALILIADLLVLSTYLLIPSLS